jgi:UDP-glucose 4-epimerase
MVKKNVLITGVAGLLGSNLAEWILKNKNEYNVIGIDDLSGGYIENIDSGVIFEKYNLLDNNISEVFEKYKFEYVFHFAAYAAEGLSPFIRKFNYNNNLLSTANIVNNCIEYDVKRLVFTSSMAVYGNGNPPFSENDVPLPIDPYGVAKFACEMDIQIAGEQHNLDWCIIRPHNVYGIKQNIWDKYRNVLGIWMYQTLCDLPMTIFGDGNQKRAFTYIDDILEPLWLSATSEKCSKEIINLGGTKEYSINEANEILQKITNNKNVVYLESRHEVKNAHPTWEKSVKLLNYKDIFTLEDGLQRMWDWAKEQPKRPQYKWDKYEINKGIYNFWK